jgi:NADH-quinone oxidoreductase subunit L
MTIPLIVLAIGSTFAGFIPFTRLVTSDSIPFEAHTEWGIAIPSVLIALIGIGLATVLYRKKTEIPEKTAIALGGLYKAAYNKFYIDEVYLFITKKIIFNYVSRPVAWFDRHIVDGTMNGIAYVTNVASDRIKGFQSGQLQQYALAFVSGAIGLALLFIYLWTN